MYKCKIVWVRVRHLGERQFELTLYGCVVSLCCGQHSSVFAITEMRDIGLYEVLVSLSLLGIEMGNMLTNFHMRGIMLL